jgi:hypothetical protein
MLPLLLPLLLTLCHSACRLPRMRRRLTAQAALLQLPLLLLTASFARAFAMLCLLAAELAAARQKSPSIKQEELHAWLNVSAPLMLVQSGLKSYGVPPLDAGCRGPGCPSPPC